ncbi:MAG: hypothetical protein ACR2FY_09630 [Pirellulaceae bacterium]
MVTAQITLSTAEGEALQALTETTGKTQDALLHEAVRQFLGSTPPHDRLSLLRQARGIWKDRTDLPDFQALRAEMDRF